MHVIDEGTTGTGHRSPSATAVPIEALVVMHEADVRSALRRVLGRSPDEDDLVQEVFARLVVRMRLPGDLCVGAWVRGVAHNLAVDEIRRRRPVPVEEARLDRAVACAADDVVVGTELYSTVMRGAATLPERQRRALAVSLSGGGTATVAAELGLSVHAAESLLSRARSGLRSHLDKVGADAGTVRVRLGVCLAVASAAAAWALRKWRAAAVLTAATGALAVPVFVAGGGSARPEPVVATDAASLPAPPAPEGTTDIAGAAGPGAASPEPSPEAAAPPAAGPTAAGGPAAPEQLVPPVDVLEVLDHAVGTLRCPLGAVDELLEAPVAPGVALPVGAPAAVPCSE